ncbi:hypothetical protein [Achromobacter animicus]|uniref:hypothetical protein n=1 Tax=Achromobacter animicus TaxID=1389935 RepID=UPI00146916FC|nr:hypothetical protein [Achromobacter animicus]CAB3850014.1 hypothetical protein LMG26691_01933 [Achromobacter animicus]
MDYRELSNKEVQTRKPHSCGWCAERIEAGERAQARSYISEGEITSERMHPECYVAMETYRPQSDLWDGWTPGQFQRGTHDEA